MTQLIDKSALVAEIKRLSAYLDTLHEQRIIEKILSIIDSLQEEPASIWHDANILPDNPDAIIIEHSEYGTSIVPASKMSRYKGAEWAYIDDLLKI